MTIRKAMDIMPSSFDSTSDPRVSWIDDAPARRHAASAEAPVVWIARSVLDAIGRSAEFALPHGVDGELLGYWVTPSVELVIVDWSGFGSFLFREPFVERAHPHAANAMLGDTRRATPTSDALRVPLGVWSTQPVVPAPVAAESTPMIHLLLERERAWRARLAMLPCGRWPWRVLRRPRAAELRVFSPPRH